MNKFRVILKAGYRQLWFDFEDSESACAFAVIALKHMTPSAENDKEESVYIKILDDEEGEKDAEE